VGRIGVREVEIDDAFVEALVRVWRQLDLPACCLTKLCYRVASARMLPSDS
jgi:hypothetical protein